MADYHRMGELDAAKSILPYEAKYNHQNGYIEVHRRRDEQLEIYARGKAEMERLLKRRGIEVEDVDTSGIDGIFDL